MAIDIVKPLKFETPDLGTETDEWQTEIDASEDFIAAKGISFEASDQHTIYTLDNEIVLEDPVNGPQKVSAIRGGWPGSHRLFDTLLHELAEDFFLELIRVSQRVYQAVYWETSSKLKKIRDCTITRTSGRVSSAVINQYDGTGSLFETMTYTLNRGTDGRVISYDGVRTTP